MKIVGVGAGPKMITEQAIEVIKAAEVVYGSTRAIELAKAHIMGEARVLTNFDTFEDIQMKVSEIVNKIINFINSKRKLVNRNFIEKAKEFINGSFALEDLNLGSIAEKVSVSPGYLSQLFKQVEGASCVEYITKVRINNAKRLLKETNLKTYEIAERSGYVDPQYFSTCFKKIVGVSPTDYRDIIVKDIF